jgi:phosphohistidine phosphatase
VRSKRLELYLLRHAIAEDRSVTGKDADRRLTAEGIDKLRKVLKLARDAGVQPVLILSSPYLRAKQTAEIAAEVLKYDGDIEESAAFTPDSPPQAAWTDLRGRKGYESILVAGHEPLLSATASWMLGSSRIMVDFRKSALVRIDFESVGPEPRGILRWMITPKLAGA